MTPAPTLYLVGAALYCPAHLPPYTRLTGRCAESGELARRLTEDETDNWLNQCTTCSDLRAAFGPTLRP